MKNQELLNWEAEYSVGVTEIDEQHENLLNLLNDIIKHIPDSRKEGIQYLKKVMDSVIESVINHFATEEEILSKTGYEKMNDHKQEHEKLTGKIFDLKTRLKGRNTDVDFYTLAVTLKEWFLSHILLYDKEAGDFFRAGMKGRQPIPR